MVSVTSLTTTRATAQDSLFERVGGRSVLERVHRTFYDKVYADPWLAQFFASIEQKKI